MHQLDGTEGCPHLPLSLEGSTSGARGLGSRWLPCGCTLSLLLVICAEQKIEEVWIGRLSFLKLRVAGTPDLVVFSLGSRH